MVFLGSLWSEPIGVDNESTHGGEHMAKMRRHYEREFKISFVAELGSGKLLTKIARKLGIYPSLPCRWRSELA